MSAARACLAALVSLLLLPAAAEAAFGGQNGKIAFGRTIGFTSPTTQVHTVNPDGSQVTPITTVSPSARPSWAPTGAKIAYVRGGNTVIVAAPDGNGAQTVLTWPNALGSVDWSPDGGRMVLDLQTCEQDECRFDLYTMDADGTDLVDIAPDGFDERNPSWSPDGTMIAFDSARNGNTDLYMVAPDGSGLSRLTTDPAADSDPDWSPDGTRMAFHSTRGPRDGIWFRYTDGSGEFRLTNDNEPDAAPAWSPDGERIAYAKQAVCWSVFTIDAANGANPVRVTNPGQDSFCNADTSPDWQPLPGPYARPKGATPVRIPLVPAYRECASPNRIHGPPLAFSSCNPPALRSAHLTVGTPETNAHPADSIGFVRLTVIAGDPTQFGNQADVRLDLSITDVRKSTTGESYESGKEVLLVLGVRMSDRWNGPALRDNATVTDLEIPVNVTCHAGPGTDGGRCFLASMTMNAVLPTVIVEGTRAIWQLDQVKLYDGGADGDADTTADNTLFAVQGLLVP